MGPAQTQLAPHMARFPEFSWGRGPATGGGCGQTPQAFAGYFPQFSMEFLIQETGSLKNQSKEVLQGDRGARDPSSSAGDLQAEWKIKLEKVVELFFTPWSLNPLHLASPPPHSHFSGNTREISGAPPFLHSVSPPPPSLVQG